VARSRFTERACRVPPQGAAGALFSVVPFVSKRSLGLVCGFVGAGGNTGSAITQVRVFSFPMRRSLHTCPRFDAAQPEHCEELRVSMRALSDSDGYLAAACTCARCSPMMLLAG